MDEPDTYFQRNAQSYKEQGFTTMTAYFTSHFRFFWGQVNMSKEW